jgi:hypothetical protein
MNIVTLPVNNLNDIPAMARRFADDVEAGVYGVVDAVVVSITTDTGFTSFGWGDADDGFKVVGMLQCAANVQIADMMGR